MLSWMQGLTNDLKLNREDSFALQRDQQGSSASRDSASGGNAGSSAMDKSSDDAANSSSGP